MFRKILYPTDFSDVSKKALKYLIQLKEAGTEEVVILHVVDTRSLNLPEIYYLPEVYPFLDFSLLGEKRELAAQEEANKIAKRLNDLGIKTIVRIEKGIPFREIIRAEAEEDISLIVIGSHGISNVQEMLLGSVSENVIRKAKKPVLVVKR
jgi:nucleotide-binding universal stress UspA family protein